MVWHVIINPKAGGGKAMKIWPAIQNELESKKINYTFSFTEGPKDATRLASEAVEKGKLNLISVGGDGTFSEVLNGVMIQSAEPTENVTIGQISLGTGNDWIKSHGIKKGYKNTIFLISEDKYCFSDVGVINYKEGNEFRKRYFINIAGFAFEGVVARTIDELRKTSDLGVITYIMAIISSLFKYKEVKMTIQIDDLEPFKGEYFNVCGGNGKFFGGGMKMLPDAQFDNGKIEISLVKKIGRFEVVRNVPGLYTGKYIKNNKVSIHRGNQLKIVSEEPIWLEADGEPITTSKDITLNVLHKKIKVVSGK